MDRVFKYVTVSRILCDTITMDLEAGTSVLILGSLGSGKYILGSKIRDALRTDRAGPIVEVNFQREPPVVHEEQVRKMVIEAAVRAEVRPFDAGCGMLSCFDSCQECVFLILTNVDSLGHHLVRQLLRELRERTQRAVDHPGRIVTLIAGEYDLRDFVYGSASEITTFIGRHYVLQGWDFDFFDDLLVGFFRSMAMLVPSESVRQMIWEKTGGNAELATSIINGALGFRRTKGESVSEVVINGMLLDDILARGAIYGVFDSHILRHAIRLVPQERRVWQTLISLLRDSQPPRESIAEPEALTLSGLAKRIAGRVVFASPIMEMAARRMFGDRFFGDLYAQSGIWEEAMKFFRRLPPAERLRPVNGWDRGPAQSSVRAARTWLDKKADASSTEVRKGFMSICYYLLGFPEVAFWQYGNHWRDITPQSEMQLSDQGRRAGESVCGLAESGTGSAIPLPSDWAGLGFACKLEGEAKGREIVTLVGDFENRNLVSPERSKLFGELLGSFIEAHNQATRREGRKRSAGFRSIQNTVVGEILQKLGVKIVDVEEILMIASQRFENRISGEYRHICFTLVNSTGDKVDRILDRSDDLEIPPKSWPLSEPGSGVHPWVVSTRKTLYIRNAMDHILTDKNFVQKQRIEGFAVVPIEGPTGVAGTIHVERVDKIVPSKDEGEDFESFGKILYSLLEQARRITLMQRSLDQTPEPHLIFDPRHKLLYANKCAAKLLKIGEGWRAIEGTGEPADSNKLSPLREDVSLALGGRRVGRHNTTFPDTPDFTGALSAEKITNRRNQTIGAFVHVEDLSDVDRLLRALDCVAKAHGFESALQSVLDAAKILRRDWARIYLVPATEPDVLVSHLCYGFELRADVEQFESHQFRFRTTDASGGHGWMCVQEGRPIVFCNTGNDKHFLTANGIEVRGSARQCPHPMNKQLGAYWLEAPLKVGDLILGNISLACDESLKSEELHFLAVFFRLVSNLLDLHRAHEKSGDIKARDARERAWRTSLSLIAHNLATRTAGFGPLLDLYKELEGSPTVAQPELRELNQLFERGYREINGVMRKAKRTFRDKPIAPKPVNVVALVSRAIGDLLAGVASPVSGDISVVADLDEEEVSSALKEIIQNAIELSPRESVRLLVEKGVTNGADSVRIIISDAGPGVPEELKRRIFEDFFTNRPGREAGEGGMGLALVRRVVEAHGGLVRESGVPGKGARFELDFPIHSFSLAAHGE